MFPYSQPIYMPDRPIRARLRCDLTAYGDDLVLGAEGRIVDWDSSYGENFVIMDFKHTKQIDIVFKSLEILDKNYLKYVARREQEEMAKLANTIEATIFVGPRGGFKYFRFDTQEKKKVEIHTTTCKEKAQYYITLLKSYNIPVTSEIYR